MKIVHIYKRSQHDSIFRGAILDALKTIHAMSIEKISTVYLSSGFFDDIFPYNNNGFSATHFSQGGSTNIVSELHNINIVCFGCYNKKNKYIDFCKNIKQFAAQSTAYYKYKCHSKLFVITVNGTPVFEIIGSSNMTKCAYGGLTTRGFSYNSETDLILINDTQNTQFEAINFEINNNCMILRYDYNDNSGIRFEDRMNNILDIIEEMKNESNILMYNKL